MSAAKTVSVIIPASNEARTIHDAVIACRNIRPLEIIVVANGCSDATAEIAAKLGCRVLTFRNRLGHDVGRAAGARAATGDVLLFLDADLPISSTQLSAFIEPVVNGRADVVLNDLDPLYLQKKRPHSTTVWRQITNAFIRKDELRIDSLLSVPHAMTREALRKIGIHTLAKPILAHLRLVSFPGLRVHHRYAIDVVTRNRFRPEEHQVHQTQLSRSEQRIIGDHLAALAAVLKDPRGGFSDGNRRRDLVAAVKSGRLKLPVVSANRINRHSRLYRGSKLSVIIPVQNEEATLLSVIREAKKIEPFEIIVVVNGSRDASLDIAKTEGAEAIVFREKLGNDAGRAIGAMAAKGDVLLFIDGDFIIPARDLYRYAKAAASGIDLAFNDLNHYLTYRYPYNVVTACKYGVNLALNRKELGVASLVSVPHAIHRRVLTAIGEETLLSPVKAQVKAILAGFSAANVWRTDVDRLNRIRPGEHFAQHGHSPAAERIIGDHLEGIAELLRLRGKRGLFPDERDYEALG